MDEPSSLRNAIVAAVVAGGLGAGGSYFVPSKDIARIDAVVERLRERVVQLEVEVVKPRIRPDPFYGWQGAQLERRLEMLERRIDDLVRDRRTGEQEDEDQWGGHP